MGWLMTLQLFGTATHCSGLGSESDRSVVRLRAIGSQPNETPSDFALARTPEDLELARAANWKAVFFIGEEVEERLLKPRTDTRIISVGTKFDYFADGDIIGIRHASKRFRTLFRRNSKHNSFLVTERCNNYCLMCSQRPKDVDDSWILDEIRESLPLVDPATRSLTFTGGEPLTDWPDFVRLLANCRDLLPGTALQVLTNGRAFSHSEIVDEWSRVGHANLIAAIPVYSAIDHVHDHVVQAKGAFDETILGILKLKDRGQVLKLGWCSTP
jgi:hypothetical protein